MGDDDSGKHLSAKNAAPKRQPLQSQLPPPPKSGGNQPSESLASTEISLDRPAAVARSCNSEFDILNRVDLICERIIQVIVPVTICALYCCTLIRILSQNLTPSQPNLIDSTWQQLGLTLAGDVVVDTSQATSISDYLTVVIVFCLLIVLVTLFILFIFYMGWQQCLIYYFYSPSLVILAIITPAFLRTILHSLNWFAVDIFSVAIFIWNLTALGMMSIFSLYAPAPLCLQQCYLIHNSALLSVLIIHALPGWAPWLLLSFLVLWDMFAVLAPYGPLNLIIGMAEKKGMVEMPGLIYSTESSVRQEETALLKKDHPPSAVRRRTRRKQEEIWPNEQSPTGTAKDVTDKTLDTKTIKSDENTSKTSPSGVRASDETSTSRLQNEQTNNARGDPSTEALSPESIEQYDFHDIIYKGVSIGLGDFIFYSLLIGLASKGREQTDFYTVLSALNAIQFGLILTLTILALAKRALPALPISLGLGISVATLTIQFVPIFSNRLASSSIFV